MKKGFTLVEVVIVVIIMAIILSMTVLLGADYLKNIQLRSEKESLLNTINYALSYVKSTNYYKGDRFSYIDIDLTATGLSVSLDSGTGFAEQLALFRSSIVLSGTSDSVRIFPYVRACTDIINQNDIVSFVLQSNLAEDKFCFDWDMRLCKIFVVSCP